MPRPFLPVCVCLVLVQSATAQVTFNITYGDATGAGFNDNTVDPGEVLTRGQLRRNTVIAVTNYMQTVFDGRGSVNFHWNPSDTTPGGFLASFGPNGFVNAPGSFQNGMAYRRLRTGTSQFPNSVDGDGQFDFASYSYSYIGGNNNGTYDMFSVALHEFTHGMGFITGGDQNGRGLLYSAPGNPDIYLGHDKFVQRGNGIGSNQYNTNISSSTYGSFIGDPSTFINGNDPNAGAFYGGKYAREIYGGAVPLYAPNPFRSGSSISHTTTSPQGVMNASIGAGTQRRAYLDYEIGMLLDMGYNVYNWNGNASALWSGGNVNSMTVTPWRTDMGIVQISSTFYNIHSNPSQAPILAPYGQITSNIVLNFAGTTSTNDLGTLRMSRINLNSSATAASTITGGTFIFGQNADGTYSALAPKIVQMGSGAFNIGSAINVADPNRGLTVDGPGSGTLTFTGNLTGQGGFTKNGTFTTIINGISNNYSGFTVVNQGVLRINGAKTGTGAVYVAAQGTLGGTGTVAGTTTVDGTIAPGNNGVGDLTLSGFILSGMYDWELGALSEAVGTYDRVLVNGDATFDVAASLRLNFGLLSSGFDPNGTNSFWNSNRQWEIIDPFALQGGLSISNGIWNRGVFSFNFDGDKGWLQFNPVPEPSTLAMTAVALALIVWCGKRKRRRRRY
jgi:autotransporter-associated beta strand protein